jgi:hypothetical protein
MAQHGFSGHSSAASVIQITLNNICISRNPTPCGSAVPTVAYRRQTQRRLHATAAVVTAQHNALDAEIKNRVLQHAETLNNICISRNPTPCGSAVPTVAYRQKC